MEEPDTRPPFSGIILADREGAPKALEAIEASMGSIIDKVPAWPLCMPTLRGHTAGLYRVTNSPTCLLLVCLTHGAALVLQVQTLLVFWEKKYKVVWEQDKEAFIRCAASLNP